jgi:hypothetical protein
VSENLAIKTDNPGDWDKKKDRAAKDLAARPVDRGLKSSWAHCDAPLVEITREIIDDPRRAPCELQALALFILDQRHPSAPRRSKVLGVSLFRSALGIGSVFEDSNEHPIEGYSSTHRSLMVGEGDGNRQILADVFAEDAYRTWRFSRDMMAELLEELLEGNYIATAFRRDAQSLLLQWQA